MISARRSGDLWFAGSLLLRSAFLPWQVFIWFAAPTWSRGGDLLACLAGFLVARFAILILSRTLAAPTWPATPWRQWHMRRRERRRESELGSTGMFCGTTALRKLNATVVMTWALMTGNDARLGTVDHAQVSPSTDSKRFSLAKRFWKSS